jgi:signal transduction histidine kinase
MYIVFAIVCFGLNYAGINYDLWYYILSLTLFPLQLFIVVALFRHKVRYANYIIWGSIITLVGSSLTLTYYIYLKKNEPLNPYANAYSYLPVMFSILFDMFLFTIALQKKIADNEKALILAATSRQQAIILERERIIADLHDDVGGGLSSIRMMSDLMSQQGEKESLHSYVTFGHKISLTAKDIAQRMHTIIWSLNSENDTIANFGEYVRQYGISYFENSPIKFTARNVSTLPHNVQISGVKRKNLFLIVKEALHNILKHSHGTEAAVEIFMIGNILYINISDNGHGIPIDENVNAVKFGNGLKNMQKRMEEIHGNIIFLGDKGTVIKINLTITEPSPDGQVSPRNSR